MLLAFSIALSLAAFFYAALIGFFALGFRRVCDQPLRCFEEDKEDPLLPFVSVVIAARNEEATITSCLDALLANDYPAARVEVIVVDDFSDDQTTACVRQVQRRYQSVALGADGPLDETLITLLQMKETGPSATGNKQSALRYGLAHARGALLMTTDADCTVGPAWIRTMAACFTPETAFVAGPVCYRPGSTLFGRLQALEFLALVATGAGGIGMKRPNMCNSANLAYRREVYERYGVLRPWEPGVPGEDEVWAQRLAAETSWRVQFCAAPAAVVETPPVLNLRAFWAQRRRWAATAPRYPRAGLRAAILGVYVFYVLLFSGCLLVWLIPSLGPVVLGALLLKIVTEAMLVYPACVHFEQRGLFRYFLPEQLLQIPYVVFVGWAAAWGRTAWKGRGV